MMFFFSSVSCIRNSNKLFNSNAASVANYASWLPCYKLLAPLRYLRRILLQFFSALWRHGHFKNSVSCLALVRLCHACHFLFYRCNAHAWSVAVSSTSFCFTSSATLFKAVGTSATKLQYNNVLLQLCGPLNTANTLHKYIGLIPNAMAIFRREPPNWDVECGGGGYEKIVIFDQYLALSRKWHKIRP